MATTSKFTSVGQIDPWVTPSLLRVGCRLSTREPGSTAVPKCKKKYTGRQQRIKGTRYDQGDWRVAAVWYERVGDDEERLVFRAPPEGPEEGGVDFFNSTELRHVLSEPDVPMTMGAEE